MNTLTRMSGSRPSLHDKLSSAACPPNDELLSYDSRLAPYTHGETSPLCDSQNMISESRQAKKRKSKKMEGLSHEETEIKRLRANEQERDRQRQMTEALEALRRCNMPYNPNISNKEDSKVYVIKTATDYIRALAQMIRDYDRGILPESAGVVSPSYPGYPAQTPGYPAQTPGYPAYISPTGVGNSTPHVGLYPGDDLCSKPHIGLGRVDIGHSPDTSLGYGSPVGFDTVEQHHPQHHLHHPQHHLHHPQHHPHHHPQHPTICLPHSINHDHFLHADHLNYRLEDFSYVHQTATIGQPGSWPLPTAQTVETKTRLMIPQQGTHCVLDQRTPYKSCPSPLDVNHLKARPAGPLLHSTPVDSHSTLLSRRELTNSKSADQQQDAGVDQTTPHRAPNDSSYFRTSDDSGNFTMNSDSSSGHISTDPRSNPTEVHMFSPERINRTIDEIFGASFLAPSPVQRLSFDSV